MIARGQSIVGIRQAIAHVSREGSTRLLDKNIISSHPQGVAREFALLQGLNAQCRRSSLSFLVSLPQASAAGLVREDLLWLTRSFLKELRLQGHQFIAFECAHSGGRQIRMYVNRINADGKAYKDAFLSKRAGLAASHLASRMGLKTVKESVTDQERGRGLWHADLPSLRDLALEIASQSSVYSMEHFVEVFNERGGAYHWQVELYYNKEDHREDLRFMLQGSYYESADVSPHLSYASLSAQLAQNLQTYLGGAWSHQGRLGNEQTMQRTVAVCS